MYVVTMVHTELRTSNVMYSLYVLLSLDGREEKTGKGERGKEEGIERGKGREIEREREREKENIAIE